MWWALGSILGAGLAVAVMVPGGLGWHWYLGLSTIPLFIAVSLFVVSGLNIIDLSVSTCMYNYVLCSSFQNQHDFIL